MFPSKEGIKKEWMSRLICPTSIHSNIIIDKCQAVFFSRCFFSKLASAVGEAPTWAIAAKEPPNT